MSDLEKELTDFFRIHQPTDEPTWANEIRCGCGESYYVPVGGHAKHLAQAILKRFALQLEL